MQRIKYIDISRSIAIFLIVLGHSIVHSLNSHIAYNIIYSFHVPLFFFISGFTFNSVGKKFFTFLRKKFFRIVIPYFIWALVFLIPYYLLGKNVDSSFGNLGSFNLIYNIGSIFYGVGAFYNLKQNTSLWFLPALFTMEIFFYFICKIKNNKNVIVLFILLLVSYMSYKFNKFILPFGINTFLNLGFFFYLGYVTKNYNLLKKMYRKKIYIIFFSIIGIFASIINDSISCVDYYYGNMLLFYLSSISLIFFTIMMAMSISEHKVLEYIGKNTMGILIFHKLIIVIFQNKIPVIGMWLRNSNWLIELIMGVIISIITIIICLWIVKILNKLKLNFLLGEKSSK